MLPPSAAPKKEAKKTTPAPVTAEATKTESASTDTSAVNTDDDLDSFLNDLDI